MLFIIHPADADKSEGVGGADDTHTAISSYLTADGMRRSATTTRQRHNDTTTKQQPQQQFLAVVRPPAHSHMEHISRSGNPLTLIVLTMLVILIFCGALAIPPYAINMFDEGLLEPCRLEPFREKC